MAENNKPIKKYKSGTVTLATWEHAAKNSSGETFTTLSFSVSRSYKKKDGTWENSNSFRISDLPDVELVVKKAYEEARMKDHKNG